MKKKRRKKPSSSEPAPVRRDGGLAAAFVNTVDPKRPGIATYADLLAWAVRPGDDVLAGELNRALAVMKANGTLQYILNRWIPVRVEVR